MRHKSTVIATQPSNSQLMPISDYWATRANFPHFHPLPWLSHLLTFVATGKCHVSFLNVGFSIYKKEAGKASTLGYLKGQ